MIERVNKLYKPAELAAAQKAIVSAVGATPWEASRILIRLHESGFRVVHVGKIESHDQ